MFNMVSRVMAGNDIGSWVETVPDTIYRNQHNWLICRSRGAHHGGTIKGSRFYVITRLNSGKPWRLRSAKGCIRYFNTPHAAALAAVAHNIKLIERWDETRLVSKRRELELEIKALEQKKATLLDQLNALNVDETHLENKDDISIISETDVVGETDDGLANVPQFLKRVTHVLAQVYKH